MPINTQKVVVGGLGAGAVLAVLDFVVNGLLMADANAAALNALNPDLAANAEGSGMMAVFICMDLLLGILLVWTYAAMRAQFGAGPRTAVIAAVQVWLVFMFMYGGMTVMGMWTWWYFFVGGFAYILMMIASTYVGAMLYKEE